MAKKRRSAAPGPGGDTGPSDPADWPEVGPREQCPCGSGRRFKACHGRAAARAATQISTRPFSGLADECDWVAMATLVPAAVGKARLLDSGEDVLVATLLPNAWPAMRRLDGALLLGLQTHGGSGDVSRDAAAALQLAEASAPGIPVLSVGRPGAGPRLQDVLDSSVGLGVEVRDGFDFWLDGMDDSGPSAEVAESMRRANDAVVPTRRVEAVDAAYWCRMEAREHLRWVLPDDEEALLDAFAVLHVSGADHLGPGTRYVGSFRAAGLMVAVWDLAPGDEAADVERSIAELDARLREALADPRPLTPQERRARNGLTSRQVTLR